jgi:predicted membrane-bound spermidine synthase
MKYEKHIIIGLISASIISQELILTRIFSAEFFHPFAFLILSLAILGLGLGALSLRLYPKLDKSKNLSAIILIAALLTLLSPHLLFIINPDFSKLFSLDIIINLILAITIISSSFIASGIAVAKILKQNNRNIPVIYMADLIGAGIGVIYAVFTMNFAGTPIAAALCALPLIVAGFIGSNNKSKVFAAALALLMIVFFTFSEKSLQVKRDEKAELMSTHWDAMAKIKVLNYHEFFRGIIIDNTAGTTAVKFDGNFSIPDSLKIDLFEANIAYLISRFPKCSFLSLGAGGGKDVLHALFEGAKEVYAVEVIPYINELMLDGELAYFTGNIYKDPRVRVITEDGRSFVKRHKNKFDIIFSFSSNSYAALTSGAFAFAENYLYTTEAIEDYWESLSDDGFMLIEHHFFVPRVLNSFIDVLKKKNIANYINHFAVYDIPSAQRNILLISKKPLNEDIIRNAMGNLDSNELVKLLYPSDDNNLYNKIAKNGWQNEIQNSDVDISPTSDDKPFIAQMGLWKNFSLNVSKLEPFEFQGYPLAKVLIIVIIFIIVLLIVPLNFLPYRRKGTKLKAAPWLYFFAIGMAFMMVEVIMIQKYTLLIGTSVYSLIVILLTMLVAAGIGSRFEQKFNYLLAFLGIIIWLGLDIFGFGLIISTFGSSSELVRILVSVAMLLPLGFFMGMPFPKGAGRIGELIDWGFAVNGTASVLGSTLIMLIAFTLGFQTALLLAALVYLLALGLFALKNKW